MASSIYCARLVATSDTMYIFILAQASEEANPPTRVCPISHTFRGPDDGIRTLDAPSVCYDRINGTGGIG